MENVSLGHRWFTKDLVDGTSRQCTEIDGVWYGTSRVFGNRANAERYARPGTLIIETKYNVWTLLPVILA